MTYKKKILITGCSGYIGSHLCKLLETDYSVHGLDKVEPNNITLDKFYHIDITRPFPEHIFNDLEYDTVVHLAALVSVGESEMAPMMYYFTNLNGTTNVLNRIPYKNFIFASTGAAIHCNNAYGISKRAAEDCVKEFCTIHRPRDYTIFRFFNVIGSEYGIKPTNPDGLMYNLMKARDSGKFTIFGNDYSESSDGTCIRDYVHVMEICHAIKKAIETPSNRIDQLGHGNGYTVKQMVNIFKKVNQCDFSVEYGPRRPGDLPVSMVEEISPYMTSMYNIHELLKLK